MRLYTTLHLQGHKFPTSLSEFQGQVVDISEGSGQDNRTVRWKVTGTGHRALTQVFPSGRINATCQLARDRWDVARNVTVNLESDFMVQTLAHPYLPILSSSSSHIPLCRRSCMKTCSGFDSGFRCSCNLSLSTSLSSG